MTLNDFRTELEAFGADLARPECVACAPSGELYVSDWRGGVTRLSESGSPTQWLASGLPFQLRPNGVFPCADGSFLVAHLGDTGGVWRLERNGRATAVLTTLDNLPIPPTNYATRDNAGRTWISVSTRQIPRQQAWRPDIADGFVILLDDRGARTVVDGLHYTNEVRVDPTGRWLYVVETFGRRLVRYAIGPQGTLGRRETVLTLGHGYFPDGLGFDERGGIWITSLISNRVVRLHGDRLDVVVEEIDESFVLAAESAFAAGRMNTEHLGPIPNATFQHLTSISFGGADRRTAYLGSLHSTCLYRFRSPVAGLT
jgi:sugar lactone lactonase YvrE